MDRDPQAASPPAEPPPPPDFAAALCAAVAEANREAARGRPGGSPEAPGQFVDATSVTVRYKEIACEGKVAGKR